MCVCVCVCGCVTCTPPSTRSKQRKWKKWLQLLWPLRSTQTPKVWWHSASRPGNMAKCFAKSGLKLPLKPINMWHRIHRHILDLLLHPQKCSSKYSRLQLLRPGNKWDKFQDLRHLHWDWTLAQHRLRYLGGATWLTRNPGKAQGLFCRTAATPEPTAYQSSGEEVLHPRALGRNIYAKDAGMTCMILLCYNFTFVPDPNQIVLLK